MEAIIKFKLPEEQEEYDDFLSAKKRLKCVSERLEKFYSKYHDLLKYNEQDLNIEEYERIVEFTNQINELQSIIDGDDD